MKCPGDQILIPTEFCRCADMQEVADLYPDDKLVPDFIRKWKDEAKL